MDHNKIKVGQKVVDRWFSFTPRPNRFGIGIVMEITPKLNSFKIQFKNKVLTYDRSHVRGFIEKYNPKTMNENMGVIPRPKISRKRK